MKFYLTLFLLLSVSGLQAQSIIASNPIKFSTTHELATDSATVFLKNQSNEQRTIDRVRFPMVYAASPFSAQQLINVTIPPLDSVELKFYFHPNHNILYNQDVLVAFDNGEAIVIELEGQGRFLNPYYSSTRNKHEQDLKDALKIRLSQGFSGVSYNTARDNMYAQLDNVGGDVTCVYTARKATFNSRAGANSNNFNCEHTYPQSFFSSNEPMKSDIHHLFPTDATSNSVRSNNPFGVVNNATWSVGGSKYGGSVFEPRDEHKGDCARAMMYFVTRYQDYQSFFASQENTLRKWHDDFPPTQKSKDRNDGIYNIQNNRNPFVDYPQFIDRISKLYGNSVASKQYNYFEDTFEIYINSVNPSTGKALVSKAIANTGNTSFKIFEASFGAGNHKVLNFPTSDTVTLEPGDSYLFLLEIDPTSQSDAETSFGFGILTDIIDFGGCMIRWDPVLSVEQPKTNQNNFMVFPNPTKGIFFLSEKEPIETLKILDITGREIDFNFNSNTNEVSLPNEIPEGIYLVIISTSNGIKTEKLSIE